MEEIVVYVHGKGGSAQEAEHYKALFPDCEVIGFDYHAQSPWEATEEFSRFFAAVRKRCKKLTLVANSIGAFFSLASLNEKLVDASYFISPVVDMEQLICNMMRWAGVSEAELAEKQEISTTFGETLSWKYLCYVREHPISWKIPTRILYGEKDALTSMETIKAFAEKNNAELTVMPGGEHWFHTKEQMQFLDHWIKNRRACNETENKDGLADSRTADSDSCGLNVERMTETDSYQMELQKGEVLLSASCRRSFLLPLSEKTICKSDTGFANRPFPLADFSTMCCCFSWHPGTFGTALRSIIHCQKPFAVFCLFQGTDHDPAVAGQCRSVWCPDQRHRLSCVPVWQHWRWRCQGIHNHFSGGCGAVFTDVGTAFPQLFANRNRCGQSGTQRISGDPQPTAYPSYCAWCFAVLPP